MTMTEFIPVSRETYEEISLLKRPDQTYDEFLGEMLEARKKQQLVTDVREVMARNQFVELDL